VNILSTQLGDVQLAITVARVYEGDDGPVLREFLTDKLLPQATVDGNRWMATWALWMLRKRDQAVRALIVSFDPVLMGLVCLTGAASAEQCSIAARDPEARVETVFRR
jgi:hypothetical protein